MQTGTWEWDLETDVLLWSTNMWRLLGLEPAWNSTTAHRLHYPAMPPGNYRFELQVIDPDQQRQSTIATLRHWRLTGKLAARQAEAPARERGGRHVLQVLERELTGRSYLVDDYSIADIAVFAYGHLAEDAGFDLGAFPAFRRWIQHIKKEQAPLPPVVPYSVDPDSWREL